MTIHPQLTAQLQAVLKSARAELMALPQVPGIELFLLNRDFPQHALSQQEMQAVMNYPAYWAFCWASGQVLADYILRRPAWVAGKSVLDFGCGSGVVAIAAARAGAAVVHACDNDADALRATAANAAHNGVQLQLAADFDDVAGAIDLIIVADVLYDRDNLPWLGRFLERAPEVLVADSRIRDFSFAPYRLIDRVTGNTLPDLDESDEFRDVRLYHAVRGD